MDILISTRTVSQYSKTVTATAGKATATVSIYHDDKRVMVYKPSAIKGRIPLGKQFASVESALDSYRSPEMKAIIRAAFFC